MYPTSRFRSEHIPTPSFKKLPAEEAFLRDVLSGLSMSQKRIPSKYFYDEEGSRLFDEICRLKEYYPTRTEMQIMRQNIREIVRRIGSEALLIEYGSGSSLKTRILLENLEDLIGYVPIDISREQLQHSAAQLKRDFPDLEILPVHADYSSSVILPLMPGPVAARRVVFFPGSTIGNFTPDESIVFLERISSICGRGGGLLIGVDLKKDRRVLEAAYNDDRGITAAFNLNVLRRINRELGAKFDLTGFEHDAYYNSRAGRIEMHLVSRYDQQVIIGGTVFSFAAGETIHTENSYKYTLDEFEGIGRSAGLKVERVWTDPGRRFSVQFLTVE